MAVPWSKSRKAEPGFSVFVVSDDVNVLPLIQNLLQEQGYTVQGAGSVGEALRLLDETGLPHVFIGDFTRPEIDGNEFLEKARMRFGRSAFPPVLFLMDSPEDEATAHLMGVQDLLPKPFEGDVLLQCVRGLIESRLST